MKKLLSLLLVLTLLVSLTGCISLEDFSLGDISSIIDCWDQGLHDSTQPSSENPSDTITDTSQGDEAQGISRDGIYTTKEDVSLYIHLYDCLPVNFITKSEARELGWSSGSVEKYAPGKCIGGDRFGNYEGLLPKAPGRTYTECDIDTLGAPNRGAKRIVFSNDGLIYYTEDHYASFTLLYGEE